MSHKKMEAARRTINRNLTGEIANGQPPKELPQPVDYSSWRDPSEQFVPGIPPQLPPNPMMGFPPQFPFIHGLAGTGDNNSRDLQLMRIQMVQQHLLKMQEMQQQQQQQQQQNHQSEQRHEKEPSPTPSNGSPNNGWKRSNKRRSDHIASDGESMGSNSISPEPVHGVVSPDHKNPAAKVISNHSSDDENLHIDVEEVETRPKMIKVDTKPTTQSPLINDILASPVPTGVKPPTSTPSSMSKMPLLQQLNILPDILKKSSSSPSPPFVTSNFLQSVANGSVERQKQSPVPFSPPITSEKIPSSKTVPPKVSFTPPPPNSSQSHLPSPPNLPFPPLPLPLNLNAFPNGLPPPMKGALPVAPFQLDPFTFQRAEMENRFRQFRSNCLAGDGGNNKNNRKKGSLSPEPININKIQQTPNSDSELVNGSMMKDGKDAAYWERRRKNNEAAKKSRDARRQKELETSLRAKFLEDEVKRKDEEIFRKTQEILRLTAVVSALSSKCNINLANVDQQSPAFNHPQ